MAVNLLSGDSGATDDATLDPNLALQQQQKDASLTTETQPIAPPPLSPTTSTSSTSGTSSTTTTSPTTSLTPPPLDASSSTTASTGLTTDSSGGVVNNTSQTITKDGINYPPGYGTDAWFNPTSTDQNDPNNVGGSAWAWEQNHGGDAAKLADMQTWTKNPDGSYTDKSGNQWTSQMYSGVLDTLKLGSSGYSADLANTWNDQTADIWDKYGMTDWANVSRGDPAATAAWQQASADAAAKQAAGDGSPNQYLQGGLTTFADGTAVPGGYNALTDLYRQLGTTPGTVNPQVLQLVQTNPALINTLPADQQATLRATLTSMGIQLPTSGASGTGTPSSGTGTRVPVGGAGGGTGSTAYTGGGANGPQIGQAILPGADPRLASLQKLVDSTSGTLAGVDRTKLAQSMFDTFSESTNPQYEFALRRATQAGAGAGRVGSGMLRTDYGNLADRRAQELDQAKRGFMDSALEGTINDQFRKFGALSGLEGQLYNQGADTNGQLRTERGYQGSLEEQAFQRALEQYQLQQNAQQQQFQNGVTMTNLGNQSDLSALYLKLSQEYKDDPQLLAQLAEVMGMSKPSGTTAPTSTPTLPSSGGYIDGSSSGPVYG